MKTFKFVHIADLHASADEIKMRKLNDSLKQVNNYCKRNEVEAIIIAGDVFDKKQYFAEKSAVPFVLTWLKCLAQYVNYIFITKGNNSHDEPKSIDLLHQIAPNIYAYEKPVVLAINNVDPVLPKIVNLLEKNMSGHAIDYIVSLMPYPTKAAFLIDNSIDNNNAEFIEKFEQVFELIGDVTAEYTCPKILAFHGNVVGSRLSSGQTLLSQDIMVAPSTLEKANADYYALGHIHLRQEIKPFMIYSGGLYNCNWGETEQKSFTVIELTENAKRHFEIPITSARPMIKVNATFDPEDGFISRFDEGEMNYTNPVNSEIRYRVDVRENERKLITDEKIEQLKDYFAKDGNTVKIEFNIIPNERESRSEKIMACRTLLDEVTEYATVINEVLPESINNKVAKIEGVEL